MSTTKPDAVFLGRLERQALINPAGEVFIDQAGGNLLYAAAGFRLWGNKPGLVTRVGNDYPQEWLEDFQRGGLDTLGIRALDKPYDLRTFTAYKDLHTIDTARPIRHFAKLGMPFPKSLLGYEGSSPERDNPKKRGALSLRKEDIPGSYSGTKAAHLCPLDFFSHSLMPTALRDSGITLITLEASSSYMFPDYWKGLSALLNGLSAFIVEEKLLRSLFKWRDLDLWEMAEALVSFNCASVLIRRGARGQALFDAVERRRLHIPAYPGRPKDLTAAGSSYSGGFLAGLIQNSDFLNAALFASATESLATEGSGAFYVMDSLPGLAQSRVDTLAEAVQAV